MLITRVNDSNLLDICELEQVELGETLGISYLTNEISNDFARYCVMSHNGTVVGYIGAIINDDNLMIQNFVVKRKYQRQGTGTLLLTHLINSVDCQSIILEVRMSNVSAISFYEKQGFKKLLTKPNYYKNEDAFVYWKKVK